MSEPRAPRSRHGLSSDSPLVGGAITVEPGAEEPRPRAGDWDPHEGELDLPREPPHADRADGAAPDLRQLRSLVPAAEPGRELDDWGRSQRVFDLVEPLLDFYYRHWFRVEVEGIDTCPRTAAR